MPSPLDLHMTPDAFREHAHETIDWIVDYLNRVESLPVQSQVEPGDIAARLPDAAPDRGEPYAAMLRDLDEIVVPGLTHWQSPNWFGYFPANTSGPSILGELLAAALGVQGMLWATSPACTEIETRVLDWLVGMLDLPKTFLSTTDGGGVLQDTASSATLCALLAARERTTGFETNRTGVTPGLVAFASSQAHSSVEKSVKIAGLGRENLRLVEVDGTFAMDPAALAAAVQAERDAGRRPFFVCATVGTTSSHAVDPVRPIGDVCRTHGLWLHVDAAIAGTAALCPEFRWIHDGLELADSYCFNPHKWMFTNFDCDCFWVRDRAALIRTLSILPEYLKNAATASGAVFDYRDWHVPLGRRFRALKLWFVIRHYGVEGLRALVREHVRLAQGFADRVRADDRFELVVDPPLNLVCFRLRAGDDATERLMNALNASGRMFLTHTKLDGRFTIRMSIGQSQTEAKHVDAAWTAIGLHADALAARPR